MIDSQVCRGCSKDKSITEFYKQNSNLSGYSKLCKTCTLAKLKEYYISNKNKILATHKIYVASNVSKIRNYQVSYQAANADVILSQKRQYNRLHASEIAINKRAYERERLKSDTNYRIVFNLRRRIRHALKGLNKSQHTIDFIGCTVTELRKHIELQFQTGMSWNNYGEWHLDHIRPCASFDLSAPEQQAECFHFSNLQPLWAADNYKKSSKFPCICRKSC